MTAFDLDAEVSDNTVFSTEVLRQRAKARMAASLSRDRAQEVEDQRGQQDGADPAESGSRLGVLDIGKSYLMANRARMGQEHLVTKEEREARRKALFEHSEANHLAGGIPNGRDPFRPMSLRRLGLKSKQFRRRRKVEHPDRDAQQNRSHSRSFDSLTGPSRRALRSRNSFRWLPTVRKHDAIPYMEALEAWRSDDERGDFWERATREFYWRESQKMLAAHRPAFSGAQDLTVSDMDRSSSSSGGGGGGGNNNNSRRHRSLFVDQNFTRLTDVPGCDSTSNPSSDHGVSSSALRSDSRTSTSSVCSMPKSVQPRYELIDAA